MLYKKYHRNFVRRFKKGTMFKWSKHFPLDTVRKEPWYDNINRWIGVTGSKYDFSLVTDGGRLVENIYVV